MSTAVHAFRPIEDLRPQARLPVQEAVVVNASTLDISVHVPGNPVARIMQYGQILDGDRACMIVMPREQAQRMVQQQYQYLRYMEKDEAEILYNEARRLGSFQKAFESLTGTTLSGPAVMSREAAERANLLKALKVTRGLDEKDIPATYSNEDLRSILGDHNMDVKTIRLVKFAPPTPVEAPMASPTESEQEKEQLRAEIKRLGGNWLPDSGLARLRADVKVLEGRRRREAQAQAQIPVAAESIPAPAVAPAPTLVTSGANPKGL